jgi:hypothetical protein
MTMIRRALMRAADHRYGDQAEPTRERHRDVGGKDDNGDAARDKMPESDLTVRPQGQQDHLDPQ